MIIDEAQFLPKIFTALRHEVDAMRAPGRFLLTGSANPAMVGGVSESLAGRVAYVELTPLKLSETGTDFTLQEHWFRGGYPLALLAKTHSAFHRWMEQYIESSIHRDLAQMFGVNVTAPLTRNLWQMLANNQGGVLNTESLSRALVVSGPTVKKYLQMLEGAYLIRVLQPWFVNATKRLVKSPKIYLRDSGMLHHLCDIATPEAMPGNLVDGGSWEGYVIEKIIRNLTPGLLPYFYRTHHGAEIDLVLVQNNRPLFAVEIKHSKAPVPSEGFYNAIADLKTKRNFVVYTRNGTYPGKNGLVVCGLPAFLPEFLLKE